MQMSGNLIVSYQWEGFRGGGGGVKMKKYAQTLRGGGEKSFGVFSFMSKDEETSHFGAFANVKFVNFL